MSKVTRIVIPVSVKYDEVERVAIAQELIDYILERTAKGKGKDGKPWGGPASRYSPGYKGGKGPVNLSLSGDMLDALTLIQQKKGQIVIGIDDSKEEGKAEGNILGTYGKDTPIPGKARNFLGLSKQEFKSKILSNYPVNNRQERQSRAVDTLEDSDLASEFLGSDDGT